MLFQPPKCFGPVVLRIKLCLIIPVTLDHWFRHLPVKQLWMVPDIIRPDPRTRAALLHLPGQEQEVAPPRLVLPDDHVLVILLAPVVLLVHSQVEEPGPPEELVHLGNQIAADAIVRVRRNAVSVFAQPGVMRGREVQLRDRLQAQRAQPLQFTTQFGCAPGALNRNLGVALVLHPVAQVDHHHVHPGLMHLLQDVVPQAPIKPEVGPVNGVVTLKLRRIPVAPHIHAQMQQIAPNHRVFATPRRTCRRGWLCSLGRRTGYEGSNRCRRPEPQKISAIHHHARERNRTHSPVKPEVEPLAAPTTLPHLE